MTTIQRRDPPTSSPVAHAQIVADFLRVVDGILVEHWDVVEDEASPTDSKSGRPMFGDRFPA